jgi:glycosyltransferase involved in cell wall biosynthesis/ubiquinone/menaquinone biosynthesis C-methylase UbiE
MEANSALDPHPCLSVVVPCYNEGPTVAAVLRQVLASPWTGEVVVIDDGSTDESAAQVLTVDDPRVRLLRQPANQGKGAALRRGFATATMPYVIVQDADLEYDPRDYPIMLEPLLEGRADVVFGSRFHASKAHRVLYYWHSVGNRLLTTLSNMTTNLNLTDMETCYKAFRREVIRSIDIEEDRFGFEPEITARVAAANWRVYEVGITYQGRTYAEGTKISWKDGVRALYCIGRYSKPLVKRMDVDHDLPARFAEADAELVATLDNLDDATNYAEWVIGQMAPYLLGDICEVGAGHGTLTSQLAAHGHVVACDPSLRCANVLKSRFDGDAAIEVVHGGFEIAAKERVFDAIVLVNVLEHIEDDASALAQFFEHLRPGGHLVVYAPAFDALYSNFDHRVGHYRRYHRGPLIGTMLRAGFEVVDANYVNSVGAFAWWLMAKKLRLQPTAKWSVNVYDRAVVPVVKRLESGRKMPVGQSILCIARRPNEPTA